MKKLFQALTIILLSSSVAGYAQPVAPNTPAASASAATTAAAPGVAATPASATTAVAAAGTATPISTPALSPEELNRPFAGAFFLTPLEEAAIRQALEGRGVTNAQTLAAGSNAAVLRAHRLIRVSGVLYRSPSDWVVWVNNQKLTPGNLMPEIVDISVKPSSNVNFRWYDAVLNQVLSITLRPHQTYDITTGVLLPQ